MRHSPPVAIAFEKAPKKAKAKKSAEAAPTAMTEYKPPSPAERMVERAHSAKINATEDWIAGRITGEKHKQVHKRANAVLRAGGHVKPEPAK